MTENKQTWVYDNPAWWINAIHWACCPIARPLPSSGGWDPTQTVSLLQPLTQAYQQTMDSLRSPGLRPELARRTLFMVKALKKWRLADSQSALARKQRTLLGFCSRNQAAQSADPIPWPLCDHMKRILCDWLPEPASTTHGSRTDYWYETIDEATLALPTDHRLVSEFTACTGRFGPGQVAERLTHPQRFARLAEWCACSSHWPEAPLDHRDFRSVTARLCAVPKDFEKDRLITVEPVYSSFVQQQVRQVVQLAIHHGPLRGTCMDLGFTDGQAIQRRLALEASRNRRRATLDLKDASDNITWTQVQQVFPAWVVHLLWMARTPQFEVTDPVTHERHIENMAIYAGMGNGTTFTVETLFFAAVIKAYAQMNGLIPFCSVFGDDVICDNEVARRLSAENYAFFRVNASKSFIGADALRESCGIFAYEGVDITVPKVDGYTPGRLGETGITDLHRRLRADGSSWARRLAYLIARVCPLPNWSIVFEGFPSIDDDLVERSPMSWPHRWNKYYQCLEAKLPITKSLVVSYPTDDRTARRHNKPPATQWYLARLCGMIGGSGARITSPRFPRHGQCSIAVPVKDRYLTSDQWVLARPSEAQLPTRAGAH